MATREEGPLWRVHAGRTAPASSARLGALLTSKKKFEAIYGPTDADEKELLFVIQLADALAAKSLPRVKKVLIQWIGPTEADKAMH
jgi:hypothetical protein